MRRLSLWTGIITLGIALLSAGTAGLRAQSSAANPPSNTKITAEQQKQLDQLAQLEERLQKSRDALHAAINEYGWNSDQADDARETLVKNRSEYRKLRRSLVASGVSVPPPAGFGVGGPGNRSGRGMGRGQGRYQGCPRCGRCGCNCGNR